MLSDPIGPQVQIRMQEYLRYSKQQRESLFVSNSIFITKSLISLLPFSGLFNRTFSNLSPCVHKPDGKCSASVCGKVDARLKHCILQKQPMVDVGHNRRQKAYEPTVDQSKDLWSTGIGRTREADFESLLRTLLSPSVGRLAGKKSIKPSDGTVDRLLQQQVNTSCNCVVRKGKCAYDDSKIGVVTLPGV